jgi:hypothetical protein
VVHTLAESYQLLDWSNAPEHCHHFISACFGKPIALTPMSAGTDVASTMESREAAAKVLLVKSWEPPMGELKDVLDTLSSETEKLILPLDWDETSVKSASAAHLQEWQRFAASLGPWKILQPGESS